MVTITITAKRGNHARSFAHLGYLGLSPVIVSGAVSTRIEEDGQALAAYKVLIRLRCYEGLGHHPGQGAGLNTDLASSTPSSSSSFKPSKINILWQTEKVLWTPSDDNLLGDDGSGWLGDTDTPWRLVIPPSAVQIKKGGHAVGSMTYRDWGTWWQIEAVISHKPNGIHGSTIVKTHAIHLPNYARCLDPLHQTLLQSNSTRFAYSITAPTHVACGDTVPVSVTLSHLNALSEAFVLKKLSVALQRTLSIEIGSDSASTSCDALACDPAPPQRWKLRHLQARPRNPSNKSTAQLLTYPSRHTSTVSTILAETDALLSHCHPPTITLSSPSSSPLSSPSPSITQSIVLQIPKPKSRYHYSIGDSCQTKFASVNYCLIVKVVIKSKSSGLETLTLNALPVELRSVPNSELEAAMASLASRSHSTTPTPDSSKH